MGQSLSVGGNNYTSQLNVTVTPNIAGKTIRCAGDNGITSNEIFSCVIPSIGMSSCIASLSNLCITSSIIDHQSLCPAIHYNILASNCGSCPTTINDTTVTCTDVPTTGSTSCNFAIQTVVCGNNTGNISDPIIVNTSISTDITEVYIVSISSLATALVVSVVISIIVIVIILIRSKAKNTALERQLSNRAGRSITHMESMYEDVTGPLPPVSTISTQDNVAYGHTKSSTAAL